MAKYLIDTDVIINLLHGNEITCRALALLKQEDEKLFSVITEAELYAGLPGPNAPEAEPLLKLFQTLQRIHINGEIARMAGLEA
jgi:predicted nucleic acid-binding protein